MNLQERLNYFLSLDHKIRLDSWEQLLSIGREFININNRDKVLAKKIAEEILYHRSLMGSSKAYESAFEIDVNLLEVSIPIARIAYGKTKPLIDFLKSGIYYSDVRPTKFNKELLEREITEIKKENA